MALVAAGAGLELSAGSVGERDNDTFAETIDGFRKTELIHRAGPSPRFYAVAFPARAWGDGFNNHRLLEPIYKSPSGKTEQRSGTTLQAPAMAA